MPGRHRVLDDVKRREICALVATGCSLSAAAKYVGCDRGTLRREAQRNEEFDNQLRNAEVKAEFQPLQAIQAASGRSWRAAAWLLERTRPEQYCRTPTNFVKIETVQDLITRCLEVIAEELADTPEAQAAGDRLTRAIEHTCAELTVAAISTRDPRRLRQVIANMSTRSEELAIEQAPAPQPTDLMEDNLVQNTDDAAK